MGLSIGWEDVCALNIPGQSIDVTELPNGRYRLVACRRARWFREADTTNNKTWIDIELSTRDELRFSKVLATGPDHGKRVVEVTPALLTHAQRSPTIRPEAVWEPLG